MKTITKKQAIEKILNTNGKVFGVRFIKRTNGEERRMAARLGVKKGVKGKGLKFSPLERGLLPVYDMNKDKKGAFRMINLDRLIELRMEGDKFKIRKYF